MRLLALAFLSLALVAQPVSAALPALDEAPQAAGAERSEPDPALAPGHGAESREHDGHAGHGAPTAPGEHPHAHDPAESPAPCEHCEERCRCEHSPGQAPCSPSSCGHGSPAGGAQPFLAAEPSPALVPSRHPVGAALAPRAPPPGYSRAPLRPPNPR